MSAESIAIIIAASGTLLSIFLSLRSTSYTELKGLYEILRKDFDALKAERKLDEEKYEFQIACLEKRIKSFEKYITKLIKQLEAAGVAPEKMDE
jgi:hypothetical protein